MEFRSLRAVFGKLSGEPIDFAPGLNIIYAPNESGKSTIAAALRVMLFGLATRERGAAADKNRFMPWNGRAMEGRLDLAAEGREITLARTTARANSPMGQFSAVYSGTGEPVPGLSGADCGEALLGVPREVYERSAFIRQSGLAIDQDKELERRIAALITTGEEEGASYSEAAAKLKKLLNARRHNKTGRIPALEAEIDRIETALAQAGTLHAERAAAEEELELLTQQSSAVAEALAKHDLADAQDRQSAAKAAEAALTESRQKAALFRELMEAEHLPAHEVLLESRSKLAALQELEEQRSSAATRQAEAKAALEDYAAPPLPAFVRISRLLCFPLLAAFIAGAYLREPTLTAASGALLLLLCGLYVFGSIHHSKEIELDRSVLERRLSETNSALYALDTAYRSAAESFLSPLGLKDAGSAASFISAALARYDTLGQLEREAEEKKLRCEVLFAKLSDGGAPAEAVERPAQSREALRAAAEELTRRQNAARRRMDIAAGQLRSYGERSELEAARSSRQEELTRLQAEYDALQLAAEALARANTDLQTRFSPALGRRAAELFARLTGGKYDAVLLDRSLNAAAQEQGSVAARDVSSLSQGAADQLYLALRLAICELVLPAEKAAPLILDDALINFDDTRCAAALELLCDLGRQRQILLLSCHSREAEYLRGREGVNILSLEGLD